MNLEEVEEAIIKDEMGMDRAAKVLQKNEKKNAPTPRETLQEVVKQGQEVSRKGCGKYGKANSCTAAHSRIQPSEIPVKPAPTPTPNPTPPSTSTAPQAPPPNPPPSPSLPIYVASN